MGLFPPIWKICASHNWDDFPRGKGVKIDKYLSCLDKVQLSLKEFKDFLEHQQKLQGYHLTKIAPWWCTGTTATARRAQSGFTLRHMKPLEPARWGSLIQNRILMEEIRVGSPVEGTVVYPIIYTVLYIERWCRISSINSIRLDQKVKLNWYTPEDWRLEHNSLEVWFRSFSFLNGWFVGEPC